MIVNIAASGLSAPSLEQATSHKAATRYCLRCGNHFQSLQLETPKSKLSQHVGNSQTNSMFQVSWNRLLRVSFLTSCISFSPPLGVTIFVAQLLLIWRAIHASPPPLPWWCRFENKEKLNELTLTFWFFDVQTNDASIWDSICDSARCAGLLLLLHVDYVVWSRRTTKLCSYQPA